MSSPCPDAWGQRSGNTENSCLSCQGLALMPGGKEEERKSISIRKVYAIRRHDKSLF